MEINESINFKRIIEIIFSKKMISVIVLILLTSITLGYVYSYYYKTPQYKSSVTILLVGDENNNDEKVTQTELTINSSLISTYSSIAKSANVIGRTIQNLGIKMSIEELQRNVEVAQIDKTQFLRITVRNENAQLAKDIVEELAKVFSIQTRQIYNLANINIVDKAEVETMPCNINHIKDMIIFVFAGIGISAALVMLVYIFDETIKDEKDLEENINIRSLGTLPIDEDRSELITQTNPKSHIVECLKTIRTNILYSTNKNLILITSVKDKEGKSWITNNIAVTFAQTGKKVILIDANLRNQTDKSEIFGLNKTEGLSDFIKEISGNKIEDLRKSREYIQETDIPNLHVLLNGTIPPNPSELISSKNMRKVLKLLKSMYDVVLLDGISCMNISDSIALSTMVDGTIIVAENKKTKVKDLINIKKSIENVDGKILGTILNKVEIKQGKYYGRRYGYYYGKEELEEGEEKLRENLSVVSLDEIIKLTEEKIKMGLEEEEYVEDVEMVELIPEAEELQGFDKFKHEIEKIAKEILKIKEIFTQFKKDDAKNRKIINNDIDNLRKIQSDDKLEILEKIENLDYDEKINKISERIDQENSKYNERLAEILERLEQNDYGNELLKVKEEIKEEIKQSNYVYNEQLAKINEKIELNSFDERNIQNNYEEKLARIKEKISQDNYKYDEQLARINERIELNSFEEKASKDNYEEKLAKLKEEMQEGNYKYNEQLARMNERIERNNYEEKILHSNYKDELSKIKENIKENNYDYNKQFSKITEKLEENNYAEELAKVKERIEQDNYNYEGQLSEIRERLEENNYAEELAKVKERIEQDNYNYEGQLSEIREEIEEKNYAEELARVEERIEQENNSYIAQLLEIREKLEQNNYMEELTKIKEIIQQNNYDYREQLDKIREQLEEQNASKERQLNARATVKPNKDNIINFEELIEKRRNKNRKEFNINEDISYEDLEKLSEYIINLKDNDTESFAIN